LTVPSSFPNPALRGWSLGPDVPGPNLWYRIMRRVFQVSMTAFWKVRVFNRHREPTRGGAVYIANHQSFLDPMLMSFGLRRPMNYMARASLFRAPGFRQVIESLNAFPVQRGKADTGALKEAMRRTKRGGQVVVFAEGTRTRDGRLGPFLPGVALLAQRAADWVVPVLIDGAWEAWPRTQALPSPGNIVVQYGRPRSRAEARRCSAAELVNQIRDELIEIQTDVRRRVGRPALDYGPPSG
jgi:1-acyl-sn-glycerol-3-phosphate acyltransferase